MHPLQQRIFELTRELAALPGPPGAEQPVIRALVDKMKAITPEVDVDHFGNIYAWKRGGDGPTLLVAAHSDELGLFVRQIDQRGFIRFTKAGGIADGLLPGRKVWVGGHLGVVGVKAGHFQTEEDRRRVVPASELYIDVGVNSAEEVRALGIRAGDPVTFKDDLDLLPGGRIAGKAIDNRLGCAVVVEALAALQSEDIQGSVCVVINVQEEVGLRGATMSAYRVAPDIGLAVDTIPCGGTPDVSESQVDTDIGRGPLLPFLSQGGAKGMMTHPAVMKLMVDTAEEEGLPYQVMHFIGGNNDATAIHLSRGGIPSGSVCLARRYSHSPVEMADLGDAAAGVKLLVGIARRLGPDLDLSFLGAGR
ncbi:MAG: M20/M25/M40 family metallo-hydrolase [Thermaerobacterales bacterium]